MVKFKMDSRRLAALFIGVIMIGSTFAFALLSFSQNSSQQQGLEIPQERILDYRMSGQVVEVLSSNGFTVVEYTYPENCFECLGVKDVLEDATNNANGQVFLQEITTTNSSAVPIVKIENLYTATQKALVNPTSENVSVEVCNALTSPGVWCLGGV